MRRPVAVPGDRTGAAIPDARLRPSRNNCSRRSSERGRWRKSPKGRSSGIRFSVDHTGISTSERVRTTEVEKDFLPNRHAAAHGRAAYADRKRSTLVMTDFRILPPADTACQRPASTRGTPFVSAISRRRLGKGASSVANDPLPPASSPGPATEDACVALRRGTVPLKSFGTPAPTG